MSEYHINWRLWKSSHPLDEFRDKLEKLNPEDLKGTKRYELILSRFFAKEWDIVVTTDRIGWIAKRLNDDVGLIVNSKKDKVLYPYGTLSYVCIDLESFILFTRILMDKIAWMIDSVIDSEKKPDHKRFNDWFKKIHRFQGEKSEELKDLFNSAVWFKDLKKLRDHYVTHSGISQDGIMMSTDNELSFHLVTHEKDKSRIIHLKDINELSMNVLKFLEDLNTFLCQNFNSLPLKLVYV